jgi:hypothetical protein
MDSNTLLSPAKTAENWTSVNQLIGDGKVSQQPCDLGTMSFVQCRDQNLETTNNNALDGLAIFLAFALGIIVIHNTVKSLNEERRLRAVFSA